MDRAQIEHRDREPVERHAGRNRSDEATRARAKPSQQERDEKVRRKGYRSQDDVRQREDDRGSPYRGRDATPRCDQAEQPPSEVELLNERNNRNQDKLEIFARNK